MEKTEMNEKRTQGIEPDLNKAIKNEKNYQRRLQAISVLWYKEGWTYQMLMEAFNLPRNRIGDLVNTATLTYPKGEYKKDGDSQ